MYFSVDRCLAICLQKYPFEVEHLFPMGAGADSSYVCGVTIKKEGPWLGKG